VAADLAVAHWSVAVARVVLGTKRYPQLFKNSKKGLKLRKFISNSLLIRKI
jgi:hypothetical protein